MARRRKALVTFEGWDGKWWRRIKVLRGTYEAVTWVIPLKYGLIVMAAEEIGKAVAGGIARKDRRSG